MLEHLGLVVDPVPGHPQRVGEVGLEQPVVADHLERDALARRGQLDAVVGSYSTRPRSAIRLSIAVTVPGETPSRSASAEVPTGPRSRPASA